MIEKKVTVVNKNGLHLRPAGDISEKASKYKSKIVIFGENFQADATSILEVSMLAATAGTELIVKAHGDDEEEAVDAIEKLLTKHYDDDGVTS